MESCQALCFTVPTGADTWEVLASVGTFASALATLLLVILTLVQLRHLKRQVEMAAQQTDLSRDAVTAAGAAATAAETSALEAARVRADAAAPALVVVFDLPAELTPQVARCTHGDPVRKYAELTSPLPEGDDARQGAWQAVDLPTGSAFILNDHQSDTLWFEVHGTVTNEGAGSARVRLDGDARFVTDRRLGEEDPLPLPSRIGSFDANEYLLRPGQSAAFNWVVARPLNDWADAWDHDHPPNPRGAAFLVLTSMSSVADVVDHVYVVAAARPIQRMDDVRWLIRSTNDPDLGLVVYPTQRSYAHEKRGFAPPPWLETYANAQGMH